MPRQMPGRRALRIKHLVAALGVATAAIVCILFAVIIWLLHMSAASLDQADARSEAKLLHSLVLDYKTDLSRSVADYSAWTELYQYFQAGRRDPAWERENLGPYIASTFAADAVLIAARDGRIVYTYARSGSAIARAPQDAGKIRDLARLAFTLEKPGVQVPASGFMTIKNVPVLAAAASIRNSEARSRSHYVLIEMRDMTSASMTKFGQQYDFSGLRPVRGEEGMALMTPEGGTAPFRLTWNPTGAGQDIFNQMIPAAVIAGIAAFLAFLVIAYAANRILARINSGEQRLLKAELDISRARVHAAEDLAQSKSAFIANMSHELRTPLNAIIGFSDMMRAETFGPVAIPKYREYLEAIHTSGRHLLNVVNDILDLSKIEAGKMNLAICAISIESAIQAAVKAVEPMAVKKNVRIGVTARGSEIAADSQALHQVLLNILSNAIKFSPEGGTVQIRAAETADGCEIGIADRGCGIPPDILTEAGKPFVQAEGVYSRTNQGTGLGLAISFMLVRMMNGSIAIQSTLGAGTTVTMHLPKATARSPGVLESAAA